MQRSLNPVKMDEVLSYIKTFIGDYGYAPTVREIAEGVGFKSPASAASYINALEENGLIRRRPESARTIEVIGMDKAQGFDLVQLPVIKEVLENVPLFDKSNIKSYVSLPNFSINTEGTLFAFEARDDSMSRLGIKAGALVFISGQGNIDNGDCVLCLVNHEPLIRYIYMEGEDVRLVPDSDGYEQEVVSYCEIVGKVVSYYSTI